MIVIIVGQRLRRLRDRKSRGLRCASYRANGGWETIGTGTPTAF